jgi:ubiquitin-protein ligase E3 C
LQLQLISVILLFLQALWQLLWVNHTSSANSVRSNAVRTSSKKLSIEGIQQRVSIVVSELLSQVEHWKQFGCIYLILFYFLCFIRG